MRISTSIWLSSITLWLPVARFRRPRPKYTRPSLCLRFGRLHRTIAVPQAEVKRSDLTSRSRAQYSSLDADTAENHTCCHLRNMHTHDYGHRLAASGCSKQEL